MHRPRSDANASLCCLRARPARGAGTKPDYRYAQKTEEARRQYEEWLSKLRAQYQPDKIQGALMASGRP